MKKKSLPQKESAQQTESPPHLMRCLLFNLLFILLIAYWLKFPEPRGALFSPQTQLLFADTSRHCQAHEITIHNSNLMAFLQENLARQSNEISTRENTRSQTRLFYVTILAALIAVLTLKGINSHPAIVGIPILLIIPMYLLEIHQDDLNRRGIDWYHAGINATEILVDLQPTDIRWYQERAYILQHVVDSVQEKCMTRKIQAAYHPTLDQIIFYFLPLFLVCQPILLRYPYSKKAKLGSSDEG